MPIKLDNSKGGSGSGENLELDKQWSLDRPEDFNFSMILQFDLAKQNLETIHSHEHEPYIDH